MEAAAAANKDVISGSGPDDAARPAGISQAQTDSLDHQLPVNKLILLYAVYEQENVKSSDLFDFILFHGYMDYFSMQNYIAELEQAGLMLEVSEDSTVYYTLLPEGDSVVKMFYSRIPHSIREDIRNYAKNLFLNESPLVSCDADIRQTGDDRYEVRCHVRDYARPLLDYVQTATSLEEANQIRNKWLKKGLSVYWNITKELKKDE